MYKSLIVFFSREKENYVNGHIVELDVGNTKVVANKLKEITNSDLFEILPLHDYPFDYNECTRVAKDELNKNARPKIKNIVSHIEEYETIYLGYPNWWGTMPMCVMTFLESYNLDGKTIVPICTHEGSGMGQSVQDIKKLVPNSTVTSGVAIYGSRVKNCDDQLKRLLNRGNNYGN